MIFGNCRCKQAHSLQKEEKNETKNAKSTVDERCEHFAECCAFGGCDVGLVHR